ncbi:MAG: hypothetical protein IPJ49_21285 [Candidatus Obscuribacter sp.]|nr:hypothetical protein [Candidatus Obscuribacter sp.]
MILKRLSVLEKRLILAIAVCAVLLVVIYQWFLKVKEEAENPAPARVRQNSLLNDKTNDSAADPDDIVESPDEDPIQIFEKTKKTQRGLGNMLREDIKLPEEQSVLKPEGSKSDQPKADNSAAKSKP